MQVGLYGRVSTEEQAQGFSIDHQMERMQAYCVSQGWENFDSYIDDGYTGTNLNRPQLRRLIQQIKAGQIQIVLVYKLDRLSRKQKDVLHLLEDIFETYQTGFRSVTEPFDTSTPFGKAMIGMLAVFAQLERETILERTRSGKSQRTRQGLWYGGPVPFGYALSNDAKRELVVNASQAALVRDLFNQFTQGKSYVSLARWLSARSTERKFSSPKTLLYMLTNPIYIGKLKHHGELVQAHHQPIVDDVTWNLAQTELNRRRAGRAVYGKYLLSSLLLCGVCGSPMKHMHRRDDRGEIPRFRDYYVCSAKHSAGGCSSRYYPDRELEDLAMNQLTNLALDAELVHAELAHVLEQQSQPHSLTSDLASNLTEIKTKLERWYQAFESGQLDANQVKERLASLENKRAATLLRIEELDELSVLGSTADAQQSASLLDSLRRLSQPWSYLNEEERSNILRAAVSKITVQADGSLEFGWNT